MDCNLVRIFAESNRSNAVALVICCAVAYSLTLSAPSSKGLLVYTGRISYGLYLLHLLGSFGYLIALLVLTYAVASISFFAYEAAINRLKRFFRGGSPLFVDLHATGIPQISGTAL